MGFHEVDNVNDRMRVGHERRFVSHANKQVGKSLRSVFVVVYDKNPARSCRHAHYTA